MAIKKKIEKNWYLLIKGKEAGPFDYNQILSKINRNEISSFDFIKALNQEDWGTLSDHEIFNVEAVSAEIKIFKNVESIADTNRRHVRSPIVADVFTKKEGVLVKGKVIEVGKGGMGIEAGANFGDGGLITSMYCSPVSESIAFSCYGKIVNKTRINKNLYKYGVQFLKISSKGENFLCKIKNFEDVL